MTLVGRTQDTSVAAAALGVVDRATDVTDVAFLGIAITIGALIGAVVLKIGGVPITLSTAGGALILGIVAGWYRAVRPTFGRIPSPALWFMNSVGLNMFIAVIGLTAGPKFVAGLQQLGFGLFLWGVVATTRAADPGDVSLQNTSSDSTSNHAGSRFGSEDDDGVARHGH